MKLLVGIIAAYNNALRNFRTACFASGAIVDAKAPIEECLQGFDNTIGQDNEIEVRIYLYLYNTSILRSLIFCGNLTP